MEAVFERETQNIYRLKIPFERVYASVFLLYGTDGCAVVDSGCSQYDVETYLLPALRARGASPQVLLLSHLHCDHGGGMAFVAQAFPDAQLLSANETLCQGEFAARHRLVKDGDRLLGCFRIVTMQGHTPDSCGVLDERDKTLITADGLQLGGLEGYGIGIADRIAYLNTLEKIEREEVNAILASHDFYPLGSTAFGVGQVQKYLLECRRGVDELYRFVCKNSNLQAEEIALLYDKTHTGPRAHRVTTTLFLREAKRNGQ